MNDAAQASSPARRLELALLPETYCVCRLDPSADIPAALANSVAVVSITRTIDELSIVCPCGLAPADARRRSDDWRLLQLLGPLDLSLVGILRRLLEPLADADCAVLPMGTYDTDYLLVRQADLAKALVALRAAGHVVHDASPTC